MAGAPALAETSVPKSQAQVQLSFAPVVKATAPAVVNVYSKTLVAQDTQQGLFNDPFFRQFFGDRGNFSRPRKQVENSLGSGVIVDPAGLIVTNNHVIRGGTDIRVVLADKREFEAKVLLADERSDLAVLKIDVGDEALAALPFGDSDNLEVGDLVLAIGNPFGVGQTVTSGIVSALARTQVGISDYQFFIQTDAAINPGNSGGALVNMAGELVGINTAIFSRSGGSIGIGFSIPSNMVKTVVQSAESGDENPAALERRGPPGRDGGYCRVARLFAAGRRAGGGPSPAEPAAQGGAEAGRCHPGGRRTAGGKCQGVQLPDRDVEDRAGIDH